MPNEQDPGITWDNKEQEVIDQNEKVLAEFDSRMIQIASAQDWGNSYLKVTLKSTPEMKEAFDKLSEDQKEDIDTMLNGVLRNIEAVLEGEEDGISEPHDPWSLER